MNKSTPDNFQSEQKPNSELQPIVSTSSPAIGNTNVVCSTWSATNQLRWKQKEVNMSDGTAMNISELQQMWRSDKGEDKWEAVPFVE